MTQQQETMFRTKKKMFSQQALFYVLVGTMFILLGWFTTYSVKFIIKNLNGALTTKDVTTQTPKFDIQGFDSLNLK